MKNLFVVIVMIVSIVGSSCSHTPTQGEVEQGQVKLIDQPFPSSSEATFETFKAYNGVSFSYLKMLPQNYQADKKYPALLVFPAMLQETEKAEWVAQKLFANAEQHDWIVIVVDAPEKRKYGWMNHPAHHALNDLMDQIKEAHPIDEGRFHFLGFEEGSRPAFSFAGMSRAYVQSLSLVGVKDWGELDEKGYQRAEELQMPILIFASGREQALFSRTKEIEEELSARKVPIHVLVAQDDTQELESLQDGAILLKASDVLLRNR